LTTSPSAPSRPQPFEPRFARGWGAAHTPARPAGGNGDDVGFTCDFYHPKSSLWLDGWDYKTILKFDRFVMVYGIGLPTLLILHFKMENCPG